MRVNGQSGGKLYRSWNDEMQVREVSYKSEINELNEQRQKYVEEISDLRHRSEAIEMKEQAKYNRERSE